jgi:GNAT superfamily N-acetyltransferase
VVRRAAPGGRCQGLDSADMAEFEVRPMREADLDAVLETTNDAFGAVIESLFGHRPEMPIFPPRMVTYRIALDPAGCDVAVAGGRVVGANFSLLRGTVGWFGPLAVLPAAQGGGIAQELVKACLRSMFGRGARLVGLETFANSPQHLHLYQKLGFRPSWTGIAYSKEIQAHAMPPAVVVDGHVPALDYVFRGFDAGKDASATRSSKAGVTLTSGQGFAVCHPESTRWTDPTTAYVPLVAALDRPTFERLVLAAEAVAAHHGKTSVATQVPGSAWPTQEALLALGYRPGGASLRMKRGDRPDYDAGAIYYCDDWH